MQVKIKSFDVAMDLKNRGIELEIRDPSGRFLGDLVVTKTTLIWCKGKTLRANGKKLAIGDFIEMMEDGN